MLLDLVGQKLTWQGAVLASSHLNTLSSIHAVSLLITVISAVCVLLWHVRASGFPCVQIEGQEGASYPLMLSLYTCGRSLF